MHKQDVRRLAEELALPPADRRSSAGICFIGRRSFGDFMAQYVPRLPGEYVCVESGRTLGSCADVLAVTNGQRASIGGMLEKTYVAGKDVQQRVVYVAPGEEHPALYCSEVLLRPVHWLAGGPPRELLEGGALQCEFQARYRQPAGVCSMRVVGGGQAEVLMPLQHDAQQVITARGDMLGEECSSGGDVFRASAFSRLLPEDCRYGAGYGLASLQQPARGIAPGQEFVVYQEDVCLGAAPVVLPGRTLAEQGI
jgi:tRNA U34 2-thiouridine synthase MnmA/TrmU